MRPGLKIALGALLIAVAGPAGFLTYRLLNAAHLIAAPGARPQSVRPGSAPSSMSANAAPDAEVIRPTTPERLPALSFLDQNGVPRKLTDWRGEPLLINFWATWCEPCRREIPLLEKLRAQSGSQRLEVVGIAVDERAAALKYAQAMHIDYPILAGGEDAGVAAIDALGMEQALPFSVFVDRQGRIVAIKIGELHPEEARYVLARLDAVDSGRLTVAEARAQIASGIRELAIARAKADASPQPD